LTRAALAGLLLAAALAGGCADDCEKACGKLDFCNQLLTMDVFHCVDACDRNQADLSGCASCLDGASCNAIGNGSCGDTCNTLAR
jgi:hypothetical protein